MITGVAMTMGMDGSPTEYRGGGFAILRALWDLERQPGWQGYATIEEICAVGQKCCNISILYSTIECYTVLYSIIYDTLLYYIL